MLADLDPNVLVQTIIGGAGVAFIGAAVKAWRDLRNGARARERDTVGSLREQRDEAERRLWEAQQDRDFYLRVCGRYAHQLERAGIEPVTGADGLIPPSMRQPARPAARRRASTRTSRAQETPDNE